MVVNFFGYCFVSTLFKNRGHNSRLQYVSLFKQDGMLLVVQGCEQSTEDHGASHVTIRRISG